MRALKTMLPAILLGAGILACVTASYATMEYSKKEKKPCTTCHSKVETSKDAMNKNLTGAGKYYHEKKTLEGYVEKK